MKIGLLTDNYPPSGGRGGIGTYTQLVAEHLASLGHEAHVFTYAGGARLRTREIGGVTVWECPTWSKRSELPPVAAWEFTRRHHPDGTLLHRYSLSLAVRKAVSSGVFDVIESPEFGALGTLVCERKYALRFAVRLHGAAGMAHHVQGLPPLKPAMVEAERSLALKADVLTVPTAAARTEIGAYWRVSLDHAQVLGNPVASAERISAPEARIAEGAAEGAVFFGRLEHRKGVDTIAAALGTIKARHPGFQARFIGTDITWPDGAKGSQIIERIAQRTGGATAYSLSPPLPHGDLKIAVQQAAVCILPSRSETFGLSFLEAMMWGVPCVVSDIAPFRELAQDGRHCLFASTESAADVAKKVCALLDDPLLAARIAENAYQHAQNWSVAKIVPQLLATWMSQGSSHGLQ